MGCRVVTVSRTLAAGGEEVARAVADELGFRYVDREIIQWAAQKAGVSPGTIEKVEQSPSLIDRILKHLGNASSEFGAYHAPAFPPTQEYESIIGQVLKATAAIGDVVIFAHAAGIPLTGSDGLLRVLVTGSPKNRATRHATRTNQDQTKAAKAIEESDRERQSYLERFYGVQRELPSHYDLVLNTDNLPPATAAELIVNATRAI